MIEPLENMRDLQSVNAKQRVGGVDAERSAPHISGVTPAMQRLAERRGIVPVDDRDVSSTSGDDSDASDAFDSSALVGAAGDRTSGSIWPVVERSILDEILAHRTTLVFVNSRGVAEKLTARLNDLYAQTRAWHQSRHCAGSGLSGRPRRVLHALRCCGRLHHHACRLT